MKEHGTKKEDGTTKGDGKGIVIAIITTLGTIIVALITSWGSHTSNSVPASPTPTPISTPSPATPRSFNNPIERVKYPNVSGTWVWATGHEPDKMHYYVLKQTRATVTSSGDDGDAQGNFQGSKRFTMNWKIGAFTAEIFDNHLDWSNGTYWVRAGAKLAPEPGNLSGLWVAAAYPQIPLTVTQFPDGRVTSEDKATGLGEGHLLSAGGLTMKWSQSPTFRAVLRGNRLYWDNGAYWIRFGN